MKDLFTMGKADVDVLAQKARTDAWEAALWGAPNIFINDN